MEAVAEIKKGVSVGFCGIGLSSQVLHEIVWSTYLEVPCRQLVGRRALHPVVTLTVRAIAFVAVSLCVQACGSILAIGILGNLWTFVVVATLLA